MTYTSYLIDPEELEAVLADPAVLVIDLGKAQAYAQLHIPGAMHMEYSLLSAGTQPAPGLLPPGAAIESCRYTETGHCLADHRL